MLGKTFHSTERPYEKAKKDIRIRMLHSLLLFTLFSGRKSGDEGMEIPGALCYDKAEHLKKYMGKVKTVCQKKGGI